MNYKEEFITFMVESGVLTFGDFVTKSGRKTPYFINTGNYKTARQIAKLGDYYAACIKENMIGQVDALYGPAYKGIPLVVTAAASLYRDYQIDIPYAFNRKEVKDHGEGGSLIGYKPQPGDRIGIVEDVITAGKSVRESIDTLRALDVEVTSLIVSVDRMERGEGTMSAIQEIKAEFGITTYPIVTIREIVAYLHNREIGGMVVVDDEMKARIQAHLEEYGV